MPTSGVFGSVIFVFSTVFHGGIIIGCLQYVGTQIAIANFQVVIYLHPVLAICPKIRLLYVDTTAYSTLVPAYIGQNRPILILKSGIWGVINRKILCQIGSPWLLKTNLDPIFYSPKMTNQQQK